jgi:hypothetical protein
MRHPLARQRRAVRPKGDLPPPIQLTVEFTSGREATHRRAVSLTIPRLHSQGQHTVGSQDQDQHGHNISNQGRVGGLGGVGAVRRAGGGRGARVSACQRQKVHPLSRFCAPSAIYPPIQTLVPTRPRNSSAVRDFVARVDAVGVVHAAAFTELRTACRFSTPPFVSREEPRTPPLEIK